MESNSKENPVQRPDLSFITKQNFDSQEKYVEWYIKLTPEQKEIMRKFEYKMPQLIACAEMLFDANQDKPESIVFKVVSETLNVGK